MEKNYGEIAVSGTAMQEVEYDYVIYQFKFQAYAKTIPGAVKNVSDKLEKFLELMEKANVTVDMFRVSDNTTEETTRSSWRSDENEKEKLPYSATRSISLEVPYTTAFSSFLMDIITDNGIDVIMNEKFYLKNEDEIRNQLLIAAMEDSKAKAELIAGSVGKKVTGIKNVDGDNLMRYNKNLGRPLSCEIPEFIPSTASIAAKLSAPKKIESQTINVIWLIN